MNRRFSRPRTHRPTDLSPGPSEVGFEFLMWRHQRMVEKQSDELILAEAAAQLRLDRLEGRA